MRPVLTVPVCLFLLLNTGCPLFDGDDPINSLSNPISRAFAGRLTYPAGEGAFVVLSGDLSGNGLPDIVTLNWSSETMSVLLATAGGYEAPEEYLVGATPRAAALADLTGNGILDIAVANESHSQVTVFFGDGTGGFDESKVISLPADTAPRDIIAVDLNNDGITDLAVAGSGTGAVVVIAGEGGGAFLEPAVLPIEHKPWSLVAGDISGNGIPDIVTANPETNTLAVLEGHGTGYMPVRYIPCGNGPTLVKAADLNRNGAIDLLVGNEGSGDISVLRNSGHGVFDEERRVSFPYPVGRFVVADLNGNTLPDLAVLLFDATGADRQPISRFAVSHGDGAGGFRTPALYGSGWGALDIMAVDLNGNGRLDLLTADYYTDTVSVAYQRGTGLFESDRRYLVAPGLRKALVADFTQNGRPDLAAMNANNNTIALLKNEGNGIFEPLPPLLLPARPLAMVTGDINGNGRQDLVVSLSMHRRLLLFLGTGSGHFLPASFLPIQTSDSGPFPEVRSLALGDMNGNGRLDIITGNSALDSVSVLLNAGNGAFEPPVTTQVGNYPLDVHVYDVNGNGTLDLVFLSTRDPQAPLDAADPRIVRWFGKGDGTFDTFRRFATGPGPTALAMADINGNGRLDAVTVHPGDNSIYLLGGSSNGDFAAAVRLHIGQRPIYVSPADINRNGRADLIVPLAGGSIILRYSRGEMKFEGPNNFIVSTSMTQSLVADLNGDGFLDLISVNNALGDIGVLSGRQP